MTEEAIRHINECNKKNPYVAAAFGKCGQTPWAVESDLSLFNSYLDWLEKNELFKLLNTPRGINLE